MKTSVEKLTPTRVKITATVSPEELKPAIEHAYEHIAEQVNVPGFRKGKVPAPIIDRQVGRAAVLQHAIDEGLEGFYREAVFTEKLRPIGRPEADITAFPNEKDFSGDLVVVIEVDVRPEIKLPKIDGLKVEVEASEVSADELADELDQLRSRFGTLITVDRPAKTGDFVQIDLTATIGGKEVDSAQSISYEIGSGELIEGIDDALLTLTADENTTFESKLLGGDHEGETAQIAVKVLSVKERELPKADDDFAQIASEFDTIKELKESLKGQVEQRKTAVQARAAREKLIEQLLAAVEIPVVDSVIEAEVHNHLEGEGRLEDDKHRAEVTEESIAAFKQQVLLDSIAEDLNVQVSQDELTQYIVQGAMQYGMNPEEFAKILTDNQQIPSIVADVARNKAIAIILGKAKVVDTKGKAIDMSAFALTEDETPAADDAAEAKPVAKKAPAKKADADAAEAKPAAKKAPAKKPAAK